MSGDIFTECAKEDEQGKRIIAFPSSQTKTEDNRIVLYYQLWVDK